MSTLCGRVAGDGKYNIIITAGCKKNKNGMVIASTKLRIASICLNAVVAQH